MNNEMARKNLQLVLQLREASDRYSQISQEFADQASEISKEVDAFLEGNSFATDPTGEEHDRPVDVQVMDRREVPSFDRLAAAVAEQQDSVESGHIRRRPTVADTAVPVIRRTQPVEKPNFWTRIADWWAERSSQRSLPVGW